MTSSKVHDHQETTAPSEATVQPVLRVGAADDQYEKAADQAADRALDRLGAIGSVGGHTLQRSAGGPVGGNSVGAGGGTLDGATSDRIGSSLGGGTGLPAGVRRSMESAFGGADFGSVRLHTGPESAALNTRVGARAFTIGQDIFLGGAAPDLGSRDGQHLIAHELAHTRQQSTGAAHRTIQRKKGKGVANAPVVAADDIVTKWVALSDVKGSVGSKTRSKELKRIDAAVATWVAGSRKTMGLTDENIRDIQAIVDSVDAWRATKTGATDRDLAITDLIAFVAPIARTFAGTLVEKQLDKAKGDKLYKAFMKLDAELARFATKNAVDIKPDRFLSGNQTPTMMSHTQKNRRGALTSAAMDTLDQDQVLQARTVKASAGAAGLVVDRSITPEQLAQLISSDEQKNSLTGRTQIPELANVTRPNAEAQGEIIETIGTFQVTYDKSDVHAVERMAALREAARLIAKAGLQVPALDIYLPKFGRTIVINENCEALFKSKIADAQFIPPRFLSVSSANTGNPKDDVQPDGNLKFMSARMGADNALVHTLVHEMGHAMHYANARGKFYNLNFSSFSGHAPDGRSYQEIAETEVSMYGNNPREMVAEVFAAAVVKGRARTRFSDPVWEMYDAFGGIPIPGAPVAPRRRTGRRGADAARHTD